MARVLVTEKLADAGLRRLADQGHEVDVRLGLSPDELLDVVPGAAALIVRSATTVTPEVLEAGQDLVVVGRAGIGLDNVDVTAATRRGVMVVNAPQSNVLSAAEHTLALLLAQARNVPQAHTALKAGKWERSRWEGVELHGKTLGVVGLGRIGSLVAQRASAFGMRLLGHDPYVSTERARQMGMELVSLDDLVARSDFLTLHVARTPETIGLVGKELLAKAKPGLRVLNTSRGGIVDEDALRWALDEGIVAGAGLDVFSAEPLTASPLFEVDSVVVTPHLGASTAEAQDKAGVTIAEQVALALAGEFVPFAVNVSASEASETVRPFLPLAERLGSLFARLSEGVPSVLEITYEGQLADYDVRILTLSVLKGLFSGVVDEPVSYVNAPQLAEERGVEVRETTTSAVHDYVNLIALRGDAHAIGGTLAGLRGEPRIVMLDDHTVEVPPAQHMLVVRNDDRPGMIGLVTTALGDAEVNISDIHVGRSPQGDAALMILATDQALPAEVLTRLRTSPGIVSVHPLS
ncbi:MAG: phosphoglycerate dehydrogenase [Actinobacteria bacterium]|nr:phosphoglycerate dehydrogenase [Actinomycetota bacterium]MBW3645409.1 phosphoglycerate dehydrogenase [Actinomycetota bacterium]